jgi:hypothetical protein
VWDPASERIHGISQEQLFLEGHSIPKVLQDLEGVTKGLVLVSDAAGPDYFWMRTLCSAGGRSSYQIESLAQLIALFDQAKLSAAVAEGRRRYPPTHRAGRDARSLAEVLRLLAGIG